MLTFEIPAVKCHHGVEVNWSRYRDTGVTDPALVYGERNFLVPKSNGNLGNRYHEAQLMK